MIQLSDIIQSMCYVFLFLLTLGLQASFSEINEVNRHERRYERTKIKIVSLLCLLLILSGLTYGEKCYPQVGMLECFYVEPNNHLLQNIIVAIFINTTLYLGGLHQELYNGGIKRKFQVFNKPKFQWNLFKRLFVVTPSSTQVPVFL
jgi:hypothetical protein